MQHRATLSHESTGRDIRQEQYLVPHDGLNTGGDVMEGAHVERLLLRPHEFGVGVPLELPHHQVEGERCQLHDNRSGN